MDDVIDRTTRAGQRSAQQDRSPVALPARGGADTSSAPEAS
ncbi:hypothetical protein OG788_33085 [Streptomyces sp. NBC_00647]